MNYAHFAEYISQFEDDLVHKFGVTRKAAKRIATRAEIDAVQDYTAEKDRAQLIIEYKEMGPVRLSQVKGLSRETLRKKFNEAIANKPESELAA